MGKGQGWGKHKAAPSVWGSQSFRKRKVEVDDVNPNSEALVGKISFHTGSQII